MVDYLEEELIGEARRTKELKNFETGGGRHKREDSTYISDVNFFSVNDNKIRLSIRGNTE